MRYCNQCSTLHDETCCPYCGYTGRVLTMDEFRAEGSEA